MLTKKAGRVRLEVQDFAGKTVATLRAPNTPGLHHATWNLELPGPRGPGILGLVPVRGPGRPAPPGQYRVVLTVDGVTHAEGLRLENDPTLPEPAVTSGVVVERVPCCVVIVPPPRDRRLLRRRSLPRPCAR